MTKGKSSRKEMFLLFDGVKQVKMAKGGNIPFVTQQQCSLTGVILTQYHYY